jgi:glycosyltransferase involved in cell wall biosynthesis
MKNIKVSIIVPVYNSEKYLEKCLYSIINQSIEEIEIICINDGSKDSSLKILQKYQSFCNKIIIEDQTNMGQGYSRNQGIKIAQGEFIMFVDSDDFLINADVIKILYNEIKKQNAQVLLFSYDKYYEKENIVATKSINNKINTKIIESTKEKKSLFNQKAIGIPWNKIYQRSLLIENDIKFATSKIYEDVIFFFHAIILAKKIAMINYCAYGYRKHSLSTMAIRSKKNMDIIHVYSEIKNLLISLNTNEYDDVFIKRGILAIIHNFKKIPLRYKKRYFISSKELIKDIDVKLHRNFLGKYFKRIIFYQNRSFILVLIRFGFI